MVGCHRNRVDEGAETTGRSNHTECSTKKKEKEKEKRKKRPPPLVTQCVREEEETEGGGKGVVGRCQKLFCKAALRDVGEEVVKKKRCMLGVEAEQPARECLLLRSKDPSSFSSSSSPLTLSCRAHLTDKSMAFNPVREK